MYLLYNKKKIDIDDCTTFKDRLIGFMFNKKTIIRGKRFPRCSSIHTFFMFQSIDVVMADKNNKIIKIYQNLKPNRIIFPNKKIYYVYELPLGSTKGFKIGNILDIEN